jgi:hypothetical protein
MKKYFYKVKSKIKLFAVHRNEMICTKHCEDDKLCYASEQDKNEGKSLEAKHKFRLDKSKIQLSNFEKEYDFTYNNNNGLLFLKGLLHGAFKKNILNPDSHTDSIEKELCEETLLDYLKDRLKLIWGQYYFIDPSNSENDDAKGYFLSNKIANTNLEPSFSFPFFSNIKNIRGNYEFHKIPNDWLHFYIGLNETVRSEIEFKKDFIKYFEIDQFIKRRNKDFEQFNNLMYISSGEIDHSIIQWFIQTFEIKNTSEEFKISLDKLGDDKVKKYIDDYLKKQSDTSIDIFKKDKKDILITKENLSILEWFKKFGLINSDNLPTERLITSIEFFYFHLTNKENSITNSNDKEKSIKNKVSYQTNNYFYNNPDNNTTDDIKNQFYDIISNNKIFKKFKESCDKILPTIHDYKKIFEEKSGTSKIEVTKKEIKDLISSYIDLLVLYGKKKENFSYYIRFNVVSHFFQRNIIGIYNPIFKEETCKGFIISPFFSNPRLKFLGSNSSNEHKFLGYFLCLIKDSDDKGRNFFNWRIDTHGHKSKTVKKFYTEYLTTLLDFGRNMGVYETQNFFYKGILEKHINELEGHATRGALSQSELRNVRHNLGSRLIYLLSNIDFYTSNYNWKFENYISRYFNNSTLDENQFKELIKKYEEKINSEEEVKLIKYILNKKNLDLIETNILQKFKFQQIANFNGYLNNRLFFLDDLTFSTPVMTTTKNAYKDIFQYLDNVKLLWNNISGIQDFKFKIEFKNKDGVLTNENDVPLAIPNDMLGIQGFVNILENVIRNTAKHNNTKSCGADDLTFSIQFKEIEISESLNDDDKKILQEYQNQFYEVIIGDNCKIENIENLVNDQNKRIDQSIKKENTQRLRDSGLGLLEMEASAAYLRMTDVTLIESDDFLIYPINSDKKENISENKYLNSKKNLNFIKAIDNSGCLAYRFFMLKPKDFLFVTNDTSELNIDDLEKNGITVKKKEDFKKELPKTIYQHNFLLVNKEFDESLLAQYKTHLPLRIINLEKNDNLIKLLNKNKKVEIEKEIWNKRFNNIKGEFDKIEIGTGDFICNEKTNYKLLLNDHLKSLNDKFKGNFNFIDAFPSNSVKTLPYSKLEQISAYCRRNDEIDITKQMLFESAINKILVIEERIQDYSETEWSADETNVKYKDIYETSGITIPDSGPLDLDAKVFGTEFIKKLKKYIIDNVKTHNFTIIHFSILERLHTENEEKNEVEIYKFLNQLSEKSHIVVTSGRGKPKNLPKSVYFVELSSLINVFIDNRSKHNISNLMYNSRNRNI